MSKCEDKLLELVQELEAIGAAATPAADVVAINGDETIIKQGDAYLVVKTKKGIKAGERVTVDSLSRQIVKKLALPDMGPILKVTRRLSPQTIEVAMGGQNAVVSCSHDVAPGDDVLVSLGAPVVLAVIPKERGAPKAEIPSVLWSDIAGQAQAKEELREAVEYPQTYAALWRHYNKKVPKGILLWGPPGCGKTMLGKALATAIGSKFVYAKGPEILDPYVGVTESKLRALLQGVKQGGVLFIDEPDAILGTRGTRNSFMEKTVVPTFLTEVDGIDEFKGTVILATNRPDTLDPAVVRDGRIDRKIEVGRPAQAETAELFEMYLGKVPADDRAGMSSRGASRVFDENLRFPSGALFCSTASGALVAGIVDKAVSSALSRDMKTKKPSKVTGSDLDHGIMSAFRQNHAVFSEAA